MQTIAAKHRSRQSPPLVEVTTRLDAGHVNGGDTSDMAASLNHADSDGCEEAFRRLQSIHSGTRMVRDEAWKYKL